MAQPTVGPQSPLPSEIQSQGPSQSPAPSRPGFKKIAFSSAAIQEYANKHFAEIFFAVSCVATAYFAPILFTAGVVAGAAVQYKHGAQIDKWTNPDNRNVSIFHAGFSFVGFTGAILSYSYSGPVQLIPLMGGVAAGSVLYSAGRKFYPVQNPQQ